jgi:predicted aspartyl protease
MMRVAWLARSLAIGLMLANADIAAAANCKMVQIADLPVRADKSFLIVDGTINGQKIGIIVDTGASRSLILRSAADRLSLARRRSRGDRMLGVGGETRVEATWIDEFKIGDYLREHWRVLVAGEHDFGPDSGFVLGEDFLQLADVEFDLEHHALRLFQPKDCDGVSLAYWATDGVGEADIEAPDDAHPQIILTVQINARPVRALLDSGAGSSALTKSEAARLGVTPETPGVVALGRGFGLGAQAVDNWVGPFETFAIGNEVIRNTTIRFADLWKNATYTGADLIPRHAKGELPMLLGADFLRAHRVLVSHSQRKIYFTYTGGPVFQRRAMAPWSDASHPDDGPKPGQNAN